MAQNAQVGFSFQFGPVGPEGMTDAQLYAEGMADARLGHELGFDVGWMIEHHFSEYYPTPNPLMFLANVAAKCPGLGLGTSVMVLPWYNPIRFAEDLAMLQTLCEGDLHIGLGRGTAIAEYKAFGIDMASSRERFAELASLFRPAEQLGVFVYETGSGKRYRDSRSGAVGFLSANPRNFHAVPDDSRVFTGRRPLFSRDQRRKASIHGALHESRGDSRPPLPNGRRCRLRSSLLRDLNTPRVFLALVSRSTGASRYRAGRENP